MTEPEPACPHCPDGHRDPATRPWAVWVGSGRDGDGQPTHLRVAPTNGAHVAESDAEWLRQVIRNAKAARCGDGTGFLIEFPRGTTGDEMARFKAAWDAAQGPERALTLNLDNRTGTYRVKPWQPEADESERRDG